MNERIKDAWGKAAQAHSGDSWAEQTAFLEKFAELIVKECADVAYKYNRCDWADVSKSIKEHFGVKE